MPKADDTFFARTFCVLYDNENQPEPEKKNKSFSKQPLNHIFLALLGPCTMVVTTLQTEKT